MAIRTCAYLLSASVLAIGGVPAYAQDVPVRPTSPTPDVPVQTSMSNDVSALPTQDGSQSQDGATPQTNPPQTHDGDIVITARRRAERLQDVPVAVTALSGSDLTTKGLTNIEQVRLSVPALNVAPSPFGPSVPGYTIRSQRQLEQIISQDPSVGVYFGDVVQTRPHGSNQSLYDIDSIQVLKGPQGTLFGRNTTGGAVLITPTRPILRENSSYITATAGNYSLLGASGAVNLGLGDTFALRIAEKVEDRDGFVRNLTSGRRLNDANVRSVRVGALWNPLKGLETYTLFDYYRSNTNGQAFVLARVRPGSTATTLFPGVTAALARQQVRGALEVENDSPIGDRTRVVGIANTTTYDLGGVTIKNIIGYRTVRNLSSSDEDGSPFVINNIIGDTLNSKQFSEELQLLGSAFSDRLKYIFGGYIFREHGRNTTVSRVLGGGQVNRDGQADNRSKSVFGQVDFRIVDGLTFTGGLRNTWDERNLTLFSRNNNLTTCRLVDANNVPISPCMRVLPQGNYDKTNYLATLSYKVAPDTLIYLTSSTGYRSGGLNLRASKPGESAPYRPENVHNYELGIKTDLFDRHVRFNGAIYHMDYTDIQRTLSIACPDAPTTLCSTIVNAATARIQGGEAELTLRPSSWLTLSGFLAYSDARYKRFITPQGVDLSGNRFAFAPKYQYGSTAEVHVPAPGSNGNWTLALTYYHQDESQLQDINDGTTPGYGLANLSAAWTRVADRPIDLRVFVNNITDKRYFTGGVALYTALGTQANFVGDPRTVGGAITFHF